jgi:hypothetical protein
VGKGGGRKAWNSTLRPSPLARSGKGLKRSPIKGSRKPLKRRTLEERYGDDPTRYGPLFKRVREYPCLGRVHLRGWHVCAPGYRPATAHHFGDTDLEGLAPCCGLMHDLLHESAKEVDLELRKRGRTLVGLSQAYVRVAAEALEGAGELPEECSAALEVGE